MNGYTNTGKTTKDGEPIYDNPNEPNSSVAYIEVNGHPRIARVCGMVCGQGMAQQLNHSELID